MPLMRRQASWNPFRELEELSERFNRMFAMTTPTRAEEREALALTDWSPSCNIFETDTDYRIRVELPDVRREDIHITLENGVLTIQGERREDKEERDMRFHRRELRYGTFLRQFTMPDDADESKVEATFKDGMLDVVIGKSESRQSKSREISVH